MANNNQHHHNQQHVHQQHYHPELGYIGIPGSTSCAIDPHLGYYNHPSSKNKNANANNVTVYATLDKSYLKARRSTAAAASNSNSATSAENGNYSTCSLSRRPRESTLNHSRSCPLKQQQQQDVASSSSTNTASTAAASSSSSSGGGRRSSKHHHRGGDEGERAGGGQTSGSRSGTLKRVAFKDEHTVLNESASISR